MRGCSGSCDLGFFGMSSVTATTRVMSHTLLSEATGGA